MGNEAVFIFDLDGQVRLGEEAGTFAQDAEQLAGFDAVVVIRADPGLELADGGAAPGAAAVDEVFDDLPDFGDVKRDGHGIALRETEAQTLRGVAREGGLEFSESHAVGGGGVGGGLRFTERGSMQFPLRKDFAPLSQAAMRVWNWWKPRATAIRLWLHQMREPLFGWAMAAVAGIWLGDCLPVMLVWAGLAVFMAIGSVVSRRGGWIWGAVLACFGWAHVMQIQDPLRQAVERRLAEGGSVLGTLTGVVTDAPTPSLTEQSWQFPLEVESFQTGVENWGGRRSLLYVRIMKSATAPAYGDRIVLTGILRRPDSVRNPGEFDFDRFLFRSGYAAEFLSEGAEGHWERLATGQGNAVTAAALRSRDWIAATVARDLEDSPDIAATVRTMVLGTREKTPDEITDAFRESGTMHVFSVSGLHVALFAGVLWFTLSLTRMPRGWIIGLSLGMMFFYVFITGLRPSAWRAAIMTACFLLGPAWNREGNLFNTLAGSALMLLGWQTQQLFQAGFTLSFGVLLAIALLQRPLQAVASFSVGSWNAPDPFLPHELRTRGQQGWYWLRERLVDSLSISTASTIGSMPLMIGYFNLITPVGIFANLFLVALSTAILVVACLSLVTAAVGFSSLVMIWNNANWALAWASIGIAKFFANVPLGHVRVDPVRLWRGTPCEVTVLALAHGGGATRIDTPSGKHWMIDCGGLKHWMRSVRPHVERAPVNQLAGIFLTHQDAYHVGALPALKALVEPRVVWRGAVRGAGGGEPLSAGDRFTLDEGVELSVLWPPEIWRAGVADDAAVVLRLDYGGWRVLFMSDAGFLTEKGLLGSGQDLRADVLVMGRHGTDFCGLPEFVRAVQPGAVVFTNNRFPETERAPLAWQARLAAQGVTLFDQALTGGVTLRMDGGGLTVRGFVDGRLWRAVPKAALPWSAPPEKPGPLIR